LAAGNGVARETLKTIAIAVLLHGVFTIGIPWLLFAATRDTAWTRLPLGPLRWIGPLLVACGAYLYVWSVARLISRQTSALPGQAPTALARDGWYARVRHPLLLGVVLILLGEAIATASLALLAYALLYWLWLHAFVTRREEPELVTAFGDAYRDYCRRVPRWIPRVR
jgi:protein-S-isoprenylcysteine O-methyltransferase Ste14